MESVCEGVGRFQQRHFLLRCERCLPSSSVQWLCGFTDLSGLQTEVVVQVTVGPLHLPTVRRLPGSPRLETAYERVLDPENHVSIEILVSGDEHVRNELLVAWRVDHEVDVRRSPWVPSLRGKHLAHWSIMRNW